MIPDFVRGVHCTISDFVRGVHCTISDFVRGVHCMIPLEASLKHFSQHGTLQMEKTPEPVK